MSRSTMLPRTLTAAAHRPGRRLLRAAAANHQQPQQAGMERGAAAAAAAAVAGANNILPAAEHPGAPKLTALSRYRALVLDSTYQPIDVVNWQRAICMEIATKVDVLEYYEDVTVKAPRDEFLLPAVLRVPSHRRQRTGVRISLNRYNIFRRDSFQCQYCGSDRDLTLDHVIPACKGGQNTWENLVTCCSRCNSHKGSKTLQELKWKLRTKPREPSPHEVTMMVAQWAGSGRSNLSLSQLPPQWGTYLQPLLGKQQRKQAQQQ